MGKPLHRRLTGTLRRRVRDPEFQGMLALLTLTLAGGTTFYHFYEHWTWVDSFFFSAMTLATVGYGNVEPSTAVSKLFTVGFVVIGLAIMLGFIAVVTRNAAEGSRRLVEERHHRRSR